MGFYYISKVHIERMYPHMEDRYISVKWWDDVLAKWQEKRFTFDEHEAAFKFAHDKFEEVAM